jgi:hypothetical protein
MDMRFCTWNVRSLYRAGLLMTVVKEISKYKLDLVWVQKVRWGRGGTRPAGDNIFFYGKGHEDHEFLTCLTMERLTIRWISGLFMFLSASTFVEAVPYFCLLCVHTPCFSQNPIHENLAEWGRPIPRPIHQGRDRSFKCCVVCLGTCAKH